MSRRTRLLVISLLIPAVLGLSLLAASKSFTNSPAQPVQSGEEQTLKALLSEVHQLRLAIQRSNLNAYRAQITIERMKLQQQRVDRLTAQLGEVHNQLASTRKAMSQKSEELKDSEMKLAQDTNASDRIDRERLIQGLKFELGEMAKKEQQQQEYETQINAQLQPEQAKLNELNERLDILQRELETQMSNDKPQPGGKRP